METEFWALVYVLNTAQGLGICWLANDSENIIHKLGATLIFKLQNKRKNVKAQFTCKIYMSIVGVFCFMFSKRNHRIHGAERYVNVRCRATLYFVHTSLKTEMLWFSNHEFNSVQSCSLWRRITSNAGMCELERATVSLLFSLVVPFLLSFFASHSFSVLTPSNSGPHGSECIL